ncbi:NADH-quinone oxidoreductase subunit J [Geodermatophilus sp. YIM 151500]|uniref:NADH-quinone oxidoreductase subunit J n=1 Tax=Geodermatophilus sp. YIM 151500 TaxID=2984531 RepID=UPI0021E40317|nr:NADH-quinone oxidoreductase subunit J [Geodermatophilus sp. YIM 151500]MCV2488416.1 NADH-quinone oxidoreductase subunit J [Geodermatophilus sp. YIM 151500]
MADLVFWVLSGVAVASGVAVFSVDSMARATYALAASFVAVGLALLLFDLQFLGVITVLMMIMEMAIMAIYMIMFMGMNPALMPMSMVHDKRWAMAAAAGTFVVLAAGAVLVPWPDRAGDPADDLTAAVGEAIMGDKMLVMLTVSPVLFATIVAALVLALPSGRYARLGDHLGRRTAPARDPEGAGR